MPNLDAVTALVSQLAKHMRQVPGLTVYEEFPTPTQELAYPCVTIFRGKPEFENLQPYPYEVGDIVSGKRLSYMVVGQYDLRLQLDVWTRNKVERATVWESIFRQLNTQLQNSETMGLSLRLKDYHDLFARYDFIGYDVVEDEAASQRGEWRFKIDLLAHCKAILQRSDYAMITIENQLSVIDTDVELES